jgi:hypothetical protein
MLSARSHGFTNMSATNNAGKTILVAQAWFSDTAYADVDLIIDPAAKDIVGKTARVVTTYVDAGPAHGFSVRSGILVSPGGENDQQLTEEDLCRSGVYQPKVSRKPDVHVWRALERRFCLDPMLAVVQASMLSSISPGTGGILAS